MAYLYSDIICVSLFVTFCDYAGTLELQILIKYIRKQNIGDEFQNTRTEIVT